MNATKCIEDVLVDRFAQLGFHYEKSDTGWNFTREIDGVEEHIEIEKSEWYKNAISCEYRKGTSSRNSIVFLRDRIEQVHVFSDENTLKEELNLIVKITEDYALKWFKKIKVEREDPIDNFLNEEWFPSIQSFISNHSIDVKKPESISVLDKLLTQDVSKMDTYAVSYCFGEINKQSIGAEWDYNPGDGPVIKKIAGRKNVELKPYILVRKTMENLGDLSLMSVYTNIKVL